MRLTKLKGVNWYAGAASASLPAVLELMIVGSVLLE